MAGPLSGIRIVDFTRLYPGPFGTQLLGDLGADVIKVEDKNSPDYIRFFPPVFKKEGAGYMAVNRNKRSFAIDLKSEAGKELFFKLVEKSDVVVEQFRPGIMTKIGLGYEKAVERNPRIIYCSITGFGQDGPYAQIPGHDLNYMGLAGISDLIGVKDGPPVVPGIQVADVAGGGLMAVIGILSALAGRERTGRGQHVDVSMFDGILPFMGMNYSYYLASGMVPERGNTFLSGGLVCYDVYRTKDEKYMTLGALEFKFWKRFCELIEKPEWTDKQYAQGEEKEELHEELSRLFLTKTRDEWVALFRGEESMCEGILSIDEVENDPHAKARNMIVEMNHSTEGTVKGIGIPIKFSDTKADEIKPPPILGQHNEEILKELLSLSTDDIEKLKRDGVID
jgi:crotonobetainyl-CoA:carnitine CoA-transferase CaiB-like acyl-CoA transferase